MQTLFLTIGWNMRRGGIGRKIKHYELSLTSLPSVLFVYAPLTERMLALNMDGRLCGL
jgi:hypothetical protein